MSLDSAENDRVTRAVGYDRVMTSISRLFSLPAIVLPHCPRRSRRSRRSRRCLSESHRDRRQSATNSRAGGSRHACWPTMRSRDGRPEARDIARRPPTWSSEFEKSGLKPAGTKGYLQSVAFSQRRILEDKSHVALVRDGKEEVLRFGDDVTINLRAELTPAIEAPLVFAGYGLSAPDAGHDDLAGLDLKGKVAVYIAGTPAAFTGALAAHYQQAGVRWRALKAAGAIGSIAIPNPKTVGTAVGADGAEPAESGDDARRSALQRSRRHAGERLGESGERRTAVRRIGPHVRRAVRRWPTARKPLPRFALPSSLRARVTLESTPLAVRQRRRAAARQRSHARPRARRADGAPRSRRHRRGGQRRSHLQRRDGQRLGHRRR